MHIQKEQAFSVGQVLPQVCTIARRCCLVSALKAWRKAGVVRSREKYARWLKWGRHSVMCLIESDVSFGAFTVSARQHGIVIQLTFINHGCISWIPRLLVCGMCLDKDDRTIEYSLETNLWEETKGRVGFVKEANAATTALTSCGRLPLCQIIRAAFKPRVMP
jgi:hypothetical protein